MGAADVAIATIKAEIDAKDKLIADLQKQLREKDEMIAILKSLPKKYTVEKIAEEYDCSKQTIYRAIQNGIVEAEALSGQEYSRNSRKYIPATELPKLFRKIKIGD